MTPLWLQYTKMVLDNRLPEGVRDCVGWRSIPRATVFDCREVHDLHYEAGNEIGKAAVCVLNAPLEEGGREYAWHVDIGQSAVAPDDICWFEWRDCAAMIYRSTVDGAENFVTTFIDRTPGAVWGIDLLSGAIEFHEDKVCLRVFDWIESALGDGPGYPARWSAAVFCLAAISMISSPAVLQTPMDQHKGVARRLAKGRKPSAKSPRYTVVGLRRDHVEGLSGIGSGKAYHFCRAHARSKGGKIERVRAHWRGDPALGIKPPRYVVRAQPPAVQQEVSTHG